MRKVTLSKATNLVPASQLHITPILLDQLRRFRFGVWYPAFGISGFPRNREAQTQPNAIDLPSGSPD